MDSSTIFVLGKKFVVSDNILMRMKYFKAILLSKAFMGGKEDINITNRCPETFKMILDYLMYDNFEVSKLNSENMYKLIRDVEFYGVLTEKKIDERVNKKTDSKSQKDVLLGHLNKSNSTLMNNLVNTDIMVDKYID